MDTNLFKNSFHRIQDVFSGVEHYLLNTSQYFNADDKKQLSILICETRSQTIEHLMAIDQIVNNFELQILNFRNELDKKIDQIKSNEPEPTEPTELNEFISDDPNATQCSPCLEYIPDTTTNPHIYKLECNHFFHINCIQNWVKNNHFTCPNCRAPINTDTSRTILERPCLVTKDDLLNYRKALLEEVRSKIDYNLSKGPVVELLQPTRFTGCDDLNNWITPLPSLTNVKPLNLNPLISFGLMYRLQVNLKTINIVRHIILKNWEGEFKIEYDPSYKNRMLTVDNTRKFYYTIDLCMALHTGTYPNPSENVKDMAKSICRRMSYIISCEPELYLKYEKHDTFYYIYQLVFGALHCKKNE